MLHQFVYVSSAITPQSPAELSDLLLISRRNNATAGLTGILLYHRQMFFQVLEGTEAEVATCFARISRDSRHGRTATVWQTEITERAFPNWAMGYAAPQDLSPEARSSAVALSDLKRDTTIAPNDPIAAGLVRSILSDFRVQG